MLGTGLEKIFNMCWLIIKLNLFFYLFSLLGGIIFGIGPSIQMVSYLFQESENDYKKVTFKKAFHIWKKQFLRSNYQFLLFFITSGLLAYNLYVSVQFFGISWLMIDFLLISALLCIYITYQYLVTYETNYEMPFFQIIKLSFMSVFFDFGTIWKLLLGDIAIIFVTWQMKGLIMFGTISVSIIWSIVVTKKIRIVINEKMGFNEEAV